ncbi:MAG TPA: RNA-binding transcriptional accessory protein [Candidatus Eubacterium faecale]|uniref:RNA-binding transcriptional accessory protein n=1 Tax=Candidatus Eubacterium faecale TaxID=2838568 RepID=A0A9D2S8Z2_9FIRM|nr:RNA-binding transcriptional accessory protein [Candidatus Eubacterium faecale]
MNIIETLANEFGVKIHQIENTVKLLDDGNTIPFIARYRKEATGSLDDQILRSISDRLDYLRSLEEQKEKVTASITEQGAMTAELAAAIDSAKTLTELDDIYRPYRPKRKTRASVAKAKGLEPLAKDILKQSDTFDPLSSAAQYLNDEVATAEEAVSGARDILAEIISDDANVRRQLRYMLRAHGAVAVKAAAEDPGVYENYADYKEPVSKIANHRILAVNRGEKENILKVSIELDKAIGMSVLTGLYVNGANASADLVREAAEDSYSRLVYPAVEREIRNDLTARASADAIKVFAANTAQLLMQPPVRGKVTIGLDPGYRTGCKVAVVDETGKVLDTAVIYCAPPHSKIEEAKKTIKDLVKRYGVQMFAIGNGTASHETEVFAADVIRELDCGITYMVVSEAGASVYSASKLAAQEFPQYDVSLRSAVSIARRLQDPLAELVKIDPKSIGVGQYQHDMPQKELNHALDAVVEDCVNSVGVDLNTASPSLLQRVSGVSASVAENIVRYREENGAFTSRTELLNVPKLGPKAYEQCAGFLRIPGGRNVLDNTAVHPESYGTAENLLKICGVSKSDVANGKVAALTNTVKSRGIKTLAAELGTGEPTLADIVSEISKPGRDPREALPAPMLRTDVMGMEDLKPGMELKGTVRNVIDFGAFVDVGVHQDGLVHISQISDKFIRHPSEVLKVGQIVTVWVLSVDTAKKRISLTMKKPE